MTKEYAKNQNITLNAKLKALCERLPAFTNDFFRGISDRTQIKTRIAYAYDLRIFFFYLFSANDKFASRRDEKDFSTSDLDLVKAIDIEKFAEFLNYYQLPHYKDTNVMITYTNTANGKMRKLSTLRSFYNYFFKLEYIKTNPTLLVDLPKLKEKTIVRLEPNESADLLDVIESGQGLTKKQQAYHKKNMLRDLAIISLLLGTGIRVSECAGLNISDIDMKNSSFQITRKGGSQSILYLPEEVISALRQYMDEIRSKQICSDPEDSDALFLNNTLSRLKVSGIQRMLEKYSSAAIPLKHISPHKLRSTYGTNLYRETNDIYLVADVLGHKDVNTTKKHYAAIEQDSRRKAASLTKLRKD